MNLASVATGTLMVVVATVLLGSADCRSTAEGFASRIRRERSVGDDARVIESIELDLVLDNQRIELRMEKNPNIRNNLPYYISSGGVITGWRPTEDETLTAYYSKETGDHLVVNRRKKNGTQTVEHIGNFARHGFMYSLMSLDTNLALRGSIHGRTDISDLQMVQIDGQTHVIEKYTRARTNYENDEEISRFSLYDDFIDYQIRQGKRSYVVDYFAILDYSVYNRWFSVSKASSDADKKQDALKQIRYYYSYVLNGVDARYASIKESDFSVNVRFIGYLIAEKPEDSPWTESSDVKIVTGGHTHSNIYKANEALKKWIKDNPLVATADFVGLFSRNYLYDGTMNPDNTPKDISGLSPIAAVCSEGRYSTCYELGQYSTIETAAHELAHNLGALHDGQSNDCKSADQYIMAVSPGELTDDNFKNPFRFSPCSIAAIRKHLATLPDNNCLLVKSPQPDVAFDKNTLPGQAYAVDEQCKQLQDEKSFYCAGASSDEKLCSRMACWRDEFKKCNSPVEQRAYDGTSCGNKKWCQEGKCVNDNAAPSAKDTCVYGDFKDAVDVGDGVKLKCSEIAAQRPFRCYDERVFGECCDTCARIRQANKPGCEYGDKDPNYCKGGADSQCYDANFKKTCCARCVSKVTMNVNSGAPACEFGDQATWCATLASNKCYNADKERKTCCQTCAKYYSGKKDCEYGDHTSAANCANVKKADCAANQNPSDWGFMCCGTCAKLGRMDDLDRVLAAMGAAGRESNCVDKEDYCSKVQAGQCYDKNIEATCCAACKKHARAKASENGCRYGDQFVSCSGNVCTITTLDCTDFAVRDLLS